MLWQNKGWRIDTEPSYPIRSNKGWPERWPQRSVIHCRELSFDDSTRLRHFMSSDERYGYCQKMSQSIARCPNMSEIEQSVADCCRESAWLSPSRHPLVGFTCSDFLLAQCSSYWISTGSCSSSRSLGGFGWAAGPFLPLAWMTSGISAASAASVTTPRPRVHKDFLGTHKQPLPLNPGW